MKLTFAPKMFAARSFRCVTLVGPPVVRPYRTEDAQTFCTAPWQAKTSIPVQPSDKTTIPAQQQGYAMAEAIDIYGAAFKNGSVTLLARIVDGEGDNVVRADMIAIKYTVYLLDDQNPDSRTAVTGHSDVALAVAEVIFDTLQTDAIWTVDTTGYNFRHVLDVSIHQAFAVAGRRYLAEFQLTPAVGQMILVRFRINVT